jgi:membrane-bound acyltransferase YfiQ involved in biofilm formation
MTHLKITQTNFILQIFNFDILSAVNGINNYIKLIHVRTLDMGFIFQNAVSSMYIVPKYLCNVAARQFQGIMKRRRFVASNGNCIS